MKLTQNSIPTKLPKYLYQYFWEVDPKKVNPRKSSMYVINRLLDKGKREAYHYVINNFPKEMIIETLKRMRSFSPKTVNFWALFFGIPKEEVVCLNKEFLGPHERLWPY